MTDVHTFSAADKLTALKREIKFRERVFERKVEAGTMTRKAMNFQIAIFQSIADDYETLAEKERLF